MPLSEPTRTQSPHTRAKRYLDGQALILGRQPVRGFPWRSVACPWLGLVELRFLAAQLDALFCLGVFCLVGEVEDEEEEEVWRRLDLSVERTRGRTQGTEERES